MKVACIAVVGKQNNPLFIQTFNQEDELKFHFIVHTSLDIVEEKLQSKDKQGALESYLGVLYPTEEFNVYGYVTCTGVKLLMVADDSAADASRVRSFFRDLHVLYCDTICNPFYDFHSTITSQKFKSKLGQLLASLG